MSPAASPRVRPAARGWPALLALALSACKPHPIDRSADAGDAAADGSREASMGAAERGTAAPLAEGGPADDEMPATSSDELTERVRHLLEAIGRDESDLATDILFPRDGWFATRDVEDPGKDWEKKVNGPFRKAIHHLSRHEKGVDGAQSVSIELGHSLSQATPKRHGWKKPLWVLYGARVTFVVGGRTRTLSIHELTAWRGAWYVTRLR